MSGAPWGYQENLEVIDAAVPELQANKHTNTDEQNCYIIQCRILTQIGIDVYASACVHLIFASVSVIFLYSLATA